VLISPGVKIDQSFKKKIKQRNNEVLYIARKNSAKGYDLFCTASESYLDYSFVAIGRSEESIDDRVKNVDFLPLDELREKISEARLVVCPSRYEHFGLVPLLAIGLGTPVVCTNRGGFPDIVTHNAGAVCEPTVMSLNHAIANVLNRVKAPLEDDVIHDVLHRFSWSTWTKTVIHMGMQKDTLLRTKFMNVRVVPKKVGGRVVWFEHVSLPGSVHIIPKVQDKYMFVVEDRHDQNQKDKLRMLSGIIEPNESPEDAAIRELHEELGLLANKVTLLWHSESKGAVEDHRYYFIAENFYKDAASPEVTEVIKGTKKYTKAQLRQMVQQGCFGESFTAISLFKLLGVFPADREC
jgi:ADP-ribose pyrophosphatase YjhB (NUDIX family)